MILKMAVPNKGRLNERTIQLMSKAGIAIGSEWGRSLKIWISSLDLEVYFLRAQDIPTFIASGSVDFGITGQDVEAEADTKLVNLFPLGFGHCRLSIAVPEGSEIAKTGKMKDGIRVATSFPRLTSEFFREKGIRASITEVQGAAEIMPELGVSDAISDLVATGSTLRTNHLVEVEPIFESQACIFASEAALSDSDKKERISTIVASFRSVIRAEGKKYIMADVPTSKLGEISRILPGVEGATVMPVPGTDYSAVHAVIDTDQVFKAVADLERIGAKGILTMPIERMV